MSNAFILPYEMFVFILLLGSFSILGYFMIIIADAIMQLFFMLAFCLVESASGFSKIINNIYMLNSIDAVSDRDFVLEFLSANSITAMHLSRLGEEWVLWASEEFGFIIPSDAVSTGSSIMPQKKNPDPMELVRGKSARVIGDLVTLLVLCKGLPQAYNRDLQVNQ